MVSWPLRMRSSENLIASTGARMRMSRPLVSSFFRYFSTLAMSCASCARLASSQNTAGVLVRRARHRELDPVLDRRVLDLAHAEDVAGLDLPASIRTLPSSATTLTVPSAGMRKVLSCEPYSSAACAIKPTFGTVPIVFGIERAVAPCSRR